MNNHCNITHIDSSMRESFKGISIKMYERKSPYSIGGLDEVVTRKEDERKTIIEENNIFLAETDGEIVGTCTAVPCAGDEFKHIAKISGLFVVEEWRNRGVGKKLLSYIEEWIIKNERYEKSRLFVRADNNKAIRMYESQGRRLVGTLEKERKVDGVYFNECIYEKIFD